MVVRRTVSFDEHAIELIEEYRRSFKGRIPNFSEAVNDVIIAALTEE